MIPALTLKDISQDCKILYENDKKIVAIMIARYQNNETKNMIKEQYDYWHYYSGKTLNIFWLGYGAYFFPNRPGQYLVDGIKCEPSVYFDTETFVKDIKEIEETINFRYKDKIGILLCNYYDGILHLDESAYINLDPLVQSKDKRLNNFSHDLIDACKKNSNVSDIIIKLQLKKSLYGILDLKTSSIVSDSIKTLLKIIFGFIEGIGD